MSEGNFKGDKKLPLRSPLAKAEKKFIGWLAPLFPKWIEGYHLTLLTIAWTAGLIIFGWMAVENLNWLWLSSAMLFLQWFTDCFDGALGRLRDTGIPKWGFYMDHLLDFVFSAAIFIGYTFLFSGLNKELFYLFVPVYGVLMVSSFLAFGASGEFKITYLGTGPTEFRLFFILLNCAIIKFGTGFIERSLFYVFILFTLATCMVIYRSQKYIWAIDMQDKANRPR